MSLATTAGGPEGYVPTWNATHRLDGPEGAWSGTERGLFLPDGERVGLLVLTGEGANEGLSAVLVTSMGSSWRDMFEGYIYEGGLPPMPEAAE